MIRKKAHARAECTHTLTHTHTHATYKHELYEKDVIKNSDNYIYK